MVSGNRDNCVLEFKSSLGRNTSPPSEGLGEAFSRIKETPFSNRKGRFFVMKRAFLHTNETPPLSANNSFHSPLHSERGRGRGCSWVVVRLLVELYLGVSFCGFPCSVRNSVSPLGFVSSVYSVLKMPQQRTY